MNWKYTFRRVQLFNVDCLFDENFWNFEGQDLALRHGTDLDKKTTEIFSMSFYCALKFCIRFKKTFQIKNEAWKLQK